MAICSADLRSVLPGVNGVDVGSVLSGVNGVDVGSVLSGVNGVLEVYGRFREALITGDDVTAKRLRTELKGLLPPISFFPRPGKKKPDHKQVCQSNFLLAKEEDEDQDANPWAVGGKIDYLKLIDKFGCQRLDQSIMERVRRITGRPHVFLSRGIFFAHRDFTDILDAYEKGEKFYLYTGIVPSSEALHLGNLIPFMFAKYLQDAFKVPVVIQLTECICKDLSVKETKRLARENAKDIIACGFDISKTFVFQNSDYVRGAFFRNIVNIGKLITDKQITRAFGIHGEDNDAKHNFPVIQAAPSFPSSFPHIFSGKENPRCLILCAVNQDPYFRMTRDVAHKLGYHAPALIVSSFFPALQGETGKIPASDPNSAIYLTDSAKDIKKKVNRYAFSGGQESVENHRKYGANLEVDIPIKYLSFFLDDEAKLEHIRTEYGAGRMLTGEVKMELIEVLTTFVETHRLARAKVTEEMVDAFMAVRPFPNKYA